MLDQGDPPKRSFATFTVHVQYSNDQNPNLSIKIHSSGKTLQDGAHAKLDAVVCSHKGDLFAPSKEITEFYFDVIPGFPAISMSDHHKILKKPNERKQMNN
ncbi:uncharacterized protein LOC143248395 [Tachypleus tridentatus]|uniref:uncharacterized protein LOC143248395 n=1 Tax=Tachypleus tridentatus TaxID=6853 RepID=UPI003FD00155